MSIVSVRIVYLKFCGESGFGGSKLSASLDSTKRGSTPNLRKSSLGDCWARKQGWSSQFKNRQAAGFAETMRNSSAYSTSTIPSALALKHLSKKAVLTASLTRTAPYRRIPMAPAKKNASMLARRIAADTQYACYDLTTNAVHGLLRAPEPG